MIPLLVALVSVDRLGVHRSAVFDLPHRPYDTHEARRLIEQLCSDFGAPKPTFSFGGDEHSDWEWYVRMASGGSASDTKR